MISNNQVGIVVTGSGTVIQGNYIGPAPDGETAFSDSGTGIAVNGGSSVTIGGTLEGAGNVISGLFQDTITLGTTTGDVVEGNIIGLSASQSTGLGVDTAVTLFGGANNNTIGSVGAGANVMADSADVAVQLSGGTNNTLAGNFIGTDSAGQPLSAFPNDLGVRILFGTGNTFSNNRISTSNQQAIAIDDGPNTFTGNRIDANDSGGIIVNAGGSTIGPGNTIVDNQSFGIRVAAGSGTKITQNSIDNTVGGLGIDLVGSASGVTPNDPGGSGGLDPDTGPNGLQNFSVSLAATASGGSVHVTGTLPSNTSTHYTVEFFASHVPDSTGFGEGAQYLGATSVQPTQSSEWRRSIQR